MGLGARKPLGKTAATTPLLTGPGKGGARAGAGRPPGAAAGRSKKIANDIAEGRRLVEEGEAGVALPADATPLDVMMMAMRKAYLKGGSIAAFPYAEKCAPYLHARIAQIELKNPDDKVPLRVAFTWAG